MTSDKQLQLTCIRKYIDNIDKQIVELLCDRQQLVEKASSIKNSQKSVQDVERVNQVIEMAKDRAKEAGGSPELVGSIYRLLVNEYVNFELEKYKKSNINGD